MKRLVVTLLLVYMLALTLGLGTKAANPNPNALFARALCNDIKAHASVVGYKFSHFICKPYKKISGIETFRFWVTQEHRGKIVHWYFVIWPDGNAIGLAQVKKTGDTGGLKF